MQAATVECDVDCLDDDDFDPPAEEIVVSSMQRFFSGLDWSAGGPIPNSEFRRNEFIELIQSYSFIHAIDVGYYAIEQMKKNNFNLSTVGEIKTDTDVDIMLTVLSRCHRLRIPQKYIGGMFILYLHLCEGIRLY